MEFTQFDYIVVGSGLFGTVMAERIANELNKKVLILEKRNHIGGNCYSETDSETGIEFHTYGTHIFHTHNQKVWDYINRFTGFNSYRHQVLSSYKERIYQMPINLETINSFFNKNLKPFEVDEFMQQLTAPYKNEKNDFESKALSMLGKELYEAFIKGYTIKQWHINPTELPASIFTRLPFRKNYDENYYFDCWQGIPQNGYTSIFTNMLRHANIQVCLNIDFFSVKHEIPANIPIIYSGPLDAFFNYKYGKLQWRTLQFEKHVLDYNDYQGNAVINYPELEVPYTRIHEPKHLHPERKYETTKTLIYKEYSLTDNGEQPYYPMLNNENIEKLNLYKQDIEKLQNIIISGRLGDYKYYDMDQTIERALTLFETKIAGTKNTL